MTCTWPNGVCKCYEHKATKPDPHGRVWMHCEEGLTLTGASMQRFVMFCLTNRIEIGDIYPFAPDYPRSQVSAAIRIHPNQIPEFERVVRAKLRTPPRIKLNSQESI